MDMNDVLDKNMSFKIKNLKLTKDELDTAHYYDFIDLAFSRTTDDGKIVLPITVGGIEFYAVMEDDFKDNDRKTIDVLYDVLKDSKSALQHCVPLFLYTYIVGMIQGCDHGGNAGYDKAVEIYVDDYRDE